MGFYLRKSVRVGPLRFNLSKSGVGVSAGIPGFRVGMGPRGNYVHAGRGGFYYRATLPPTGSGARQSSRAEPRANSVHQSLRATVGVEREIDSGGTLLMQDSSADGLLGELNDKHRRLRLAPWICTAAIAGVALAVAKYSNQTGFLAAVVGAITIVTSLIADALRKTTVILYDLDEDASASFKALVEALQQIGQAQRLWHIASSADVLNRKYHAGAGSQIKRAVTQVSVGEVPLVKCNLEVPALTVGRQTLYFMPERLLVRDFEGFGAIPYAILDVAREPIRFIETEGVPSDSRVVDGTWHFVNKNGGPDRRFRDNRQIPICEYESIHFRSRSGLNELLYASKVGVAEALTRYLAIEGPSLSRST